jgi:hypothetical protein
MDFSHTWQQTASWLKISIIANNNQWDDVHFNNQSEGFKDVLRSRDTSVLPCEDIPPYFQSRWTWNTPLQHFASLPWTEPTTVPSGVITHSANNYPISVFTTLKLKTPLPRCSILTYSLSVLILLSLSCSQQTLSAQFRAWKRGYAGQSVGTVPW